MDDLLDDLTRAAQRCERAVQTLKEDPFDAIRERIQQQVKAAHRSWSGSWIGYHADLHRELRSPTPGRALRCRVGLSAGDEQFYTRTVGHV